MEHANFISEQLKVFVGVDGQELDMEETKFSLMNEYQSSMNKLLEGDEQDKESFRTANEPIRRDKIRVVNRNGARNMWNTVEKKLRVSVEKIFIANPGIYDFVVTTELILCHFLDAGVILDSSIYHEKFSGVLLNIGLKNSSNNSNTKKNYLTMSFKDDSFKASFYRLTLHAGEFEVWRSYRGGIELWGLLLYTGGVLCIRQL
tara:strand:- start:12 stop:620 length:609 start_codon:yes stop_codon:yes gene_type:complete